MGLGISFPTFDAKEAQISLPWLQRNKLERKEPSATRVRVEEKLSQLMTVIQFEIEWLRWEDAILREHLLQQQQQQQQPQQQQQQPQ